MLLWTDMFGRSGGGFSGSMVRFCMAQEFNFGTLDFRALTPCRGRAFLVRSLTDALRAHHVFTCV